MCLGFSCLSIAQTLSGTVTDQSGVPMPFVNVVELSPADSAYVSGIVTQGDGTFVMENVKAGDILRISCIGYKTQYVGYEGQTSLTIQLAENAAVLGEAVVKSTLPKTVLRGEGMQTTVAGTILEKTSDMDHLLSRLPGVTAKDGAIEVFGRGTPVIYINGRKMLDATELQRLQPTDIQKVEVITNPGARYAANVKCVIRITTKKPQGEGFSLDTKTKLRVNEDWRLSSYETLSMNYRKGGLDLSAYFFGEYSHTPDNKQIDQYTYLSDTWKQTTKTNQEYTYINPYARLNLSYMFNAENSVGVCFGYDRYARAEGDGTMQATSLKNEELVETSAEDYFSPGRSSSYLVNAYYVGKIGKIGIDFNTDYYWYGEKRWMDVKETVTDASEAVETTAVNSYRNNRNAMVASKLVLSLPLWKGALSFGGEYSHVNRHMHYTIVPEVTSNENDKVRESMTSAFLDYSRAFGPLQLQAGLRYEYNDFDYYDNDVFVSDQSKTYGNWFPTLTLSMPVGKTQMQLTYAADIYRPSYSDLRSGVLYENQYIYESGNPFLVPSITRNLSYALSWKWIYLQLIYSHISDEICTMTQIYQDDPKTSLSRPENLNSYNSFQAALTLGPTFGIWHPQLQLMLFKQWLKMDTPMGNRLNNPVGIFQLTNTLDFKWLTASVTMTAQTEGNMGNKYFHRGFFNTDLSLYKSLLKDRLTLTLDVSDLFGTANQHRTFLSGAQRLMHYHGDGVSNVTFSIRYRFNTSNSKYKGTGAGASQKSRM